MQTSKILQYGILVAEKDASSVQQDSSYSKVSAG